MQLRNSTIRAKTAPYFYDKVGKYILLWLDQNRASRVQPGNQKELAHILRTKYNIEVSASQMSRYISGHHTMPPEVSTALIERLGFKASYFSEYYIQQRDKLTTENLTKDDLLKLIAEQNLMMQEWKQYAFGYSSRFQKLQDQNYELVRAANNYMNEIEKLREQIKTLKKELSQKE